MIDDVNARLRGVEPNGESQREPAKPSTSETGQNDKLTFERITCAELDADESEQAYLVENVVPVGQPGILSGPPKVLKTSLLVDLGISIATATPFLGVHEVRRSAVVGIMSGESGIKTLRDCARSVAESKGYQLRFVDKLIFSPDVPRVGDLFHRDALSRFIRSDGIELLAIDPTYLALPADDAGNLFSQGMLLRSANEVCQAEGCQLLLVHHNRKNGALPNAMPSLSEIAWSGFQEWARWWLLLSRRTPYEVGSGLHELYASTGGSAGHSWLGAVSIDEGPFGARRWAVSVQSVTQASEAADATRERHKQEAHAEKLGRDYKKLIESAASFPDGETLRRLREFAGLSGSSANDALSAALKAGDLVPCRVVKNGKPVDGFRLR